VLDLAELMYFC